MAEADCSRQCRYCGNGFAYKGGQRGRKPMYCSAACRKKQSLITGPRCKVADCGKPSVAHGYCGKHARRVKASGDPHKVKTGRRVSKACGYCGSVMALKPYEARRMTYCSRQCAARAVAIGKGQTLRDDVPVSCHGCGITTRRKVKKDDAGRYCSRRCNTDSIARVASERAALQRISKAWNSVWEPSPLVVAEVAALRRIARYVERPRKRMASCRKCDTPMVWVVKAGGSSRVCDACKAARHKEYTDAFKRTETYRKARRVAKSRRRARIRALPNEAIDPMAVFERDKWKCQLCGKRTPKRLRGQMVADAPELDHIIPLALGGGHTWANVQCACRECNGRKGATAQGQLGLPLVA